MEKRQFYKARFISPSSDTLPVCMEKFKYLKSASFHAAWQNIIQPLTDTVRPGISVSVFGKQ